ncbi:hypothetical protein [Arthrobacter sp. HLT1-20]
MGNFSCGSDDILADLAERARRDFQLRVEAKARFDAEGRAAIPPSRRAELGLTEQHYRKAEVWLRSRQEWERERLEVGIEYFSTFSMDVLHTFVNDLDRDGPFAKAHGLRSNLGDPQMPVEPYPRGLEEFIRTFHHRYSDERYIRDFITFQPSMTEIIQLAWAALNLEAPIGLTEAANCRYTKPAVERLLLVAQALHAAEYGYAVKFVQSTGYAAGDEIAYRTEHLKYLTPDFAQYILNASPSDETLAKKLTSGSRTRFGLTLEGVTVERFLYFLDRCTTSAARRSH